MLSLNVHNYAQLIMVYCICNVLLPLLTVYLQLYVTLFIIWILMISCLDFTKMHWLSNPDFIAPLFITIIMACTN